MSDVAAGNFYRNCSGSNFRQWSYRDEHKTSSPPLMEATGENKGTALRAGEWYTGPLLRGLSQGDGKDTPVCPLCLALGLTPGSDSGGQEGRRAEAGRMRTQLVPHCLNLRLRPHRSRLTFCLCPQLGAPSYISLKGWILPLFVPKAGRLLVSLPYFSLRAFVCADPPA